MIFIEKKYVLIYINFMNTRNNPTRNVSVGKRDASKDSKSFQSAR